MDIKLSTSAHKFCRDGQEARLTISILLSVTYYLQSQIFVCSSHNSTQALLSGSYHIPQCVSHASKSTSILTIGQTSTSHPQLATPTSIPHPQHPPPHPHRFVTASITDTVDPPMIIHPLQQPTPRKSASSNSASNRSENPVTIT